MYKYSILLAFLFSSVLFSQTMNIHSTDGSVTQFNLIEIDSVTFSVPNNFLFSEDFESGSLNNYDSIGFTGDKWNLTTDSYSGTYSLEGTTDDGATGHLSVLVNQNSIFSPNEPVRISAYVKNTSLSSWNRPNSIIYSASSDSILGYSPNVEHNIYLSLSKITADGHEEIVPRTELININTDEWYHWVVYFNPVNNYSKFELYDLSGTLLGFIESNNTPYLSDKIGLKLWRGKGVFDNLSVQSW